MTPSIIYQHQNTKFALFFAFFLAVVSSQTQARNITGQWNGLLNFQGINLRIVFHINKTGDSYTATMDRFACRIRHNQANLLADRIEGLGRLDSINNEQLTINNYKL